MFSNIFGPNPRIISQFSWNRAPVKMKNFCIIFALVAVAVNIDAAKRCYPVPETPSPTLTCGENEDYHQCSTLCGEKTCANREDRYCGLGCQERCLCKEGYIRDENKRCIKVEECPVVDPPVPICSKNHEEYKECGTACPLTCDSPPTQICTKQCVAGCFCETGYVRDKNGECILQEECPKPACPRHEVYAECEGQKECQKSCRYPTRGCTGACVAGCVCEEGYVRDAKNKCIPLTSCSDKDCGENEYFEKCGSSCGPTSCDEYRGYVACRPIRGCFPACFCKEGYYFLRDRGCIPADDCPIRDRKRDA